MGFTMGQQASAAPCRAGVDNRKGHTLPSSRQPKLTEAAALLADRARPGAASKKKRPKKEKKTAEDARRKRKTESLTKKELAGKPNAIPTAT